MRNAKESGCFPYKSKLVCFMEVFPDGTIASIKYIDIDGNTFIYLIDTDNNIFKAKAGANEDMLLLNIADKVELSYSGRTIVSFKKIS